MNSNQQEYTAIGDENFTVPGTQLNENNSDNSYPTTLGIPEKFLAPLCYVFGFFSSILMLVFEKKSDYVRFHAWQSCILGLAASVSYLNNFPL
ncbi:hypothetical protein BB559_006738 [Furculomyces boomerangus]|uniref:Uncharacterized protein n=1 Tax=Furculomyces boomerangus TaxID=61424 RepID=A0A2T9Y0Q0_9FUNG|nr:hypothetical protein BB559_006738 [Furculomyces boomerangus]